MGEVGGVGFLRIGTEGAAVDINGPGTIVSAEGGRGCGDAVSVEGDVGVGTNVGEGISGMRSEGASVGLRVGCPS